jgi:hypothetical protein
MLRLGCNAFDSLGESAPTRRKNTFESSIMRFRKLLLICEVFNEKLKKLHSHNV